MIEILFGILAIMAMVIMGFNSYNERKSDERRIDDLMNRFMAQNYHEYAVFEHQKREQEKEKVINKSVFEEQDIFPVN